MYTRERLFNLVTMNVKRDMYTVSVELLSLQNIAITRYELTYLIEVNSKWSVISV